MEKMMKAAVFESEGNLVLKEVPVPSIDGQNIWTVVFSIMVLLV